MFGKSPSAWFITLLSIIGILPGGRSRSLDNMRFLAWMIAVTSLSVIWIYTNKQQIGFLLNDLTIANLMTLTTSWLTYVFLMIGTVLALSTAFKRYPLLVKDNNIPAPDGLFLFMLVIMSNVWYWYTNINNKKQLLSMFSSTFSKVNAVAVWIFNAELTLVCAFVIGVCVAQFKGKMLRTENEKSLTRVILLGENNVKVFRSLKFFLSPIMFVVFVAHSLSVVGYSYLSLTFKAWETIPFILFSSLNMAYVCVIIDGCYGTFKSSSDYLRLIIYIFLILKKGIVNFCFIIYMIIQNTHVSGQIF